MKKSAEIVNRLLSCGKPIRIKLLGDSITHGMGGTGYKEDGEVFINDIARNPDGYCWANSFKKYMYEKFGAEVINNGCSGKAIEFII